MAPTANLPSKNPTESFWLSELSPTLKGYRSSADVPSEADVVIVGSGISGAFAAREMFQNALARERRPRVVMFEAREVCSGASGRNGGHCQPALYSGDAEVTRFEMATYGFISELLRESDIACDWQPRGAVAAFYSQADFDRALDKFDRSRVDAPEIVDHLQVVGPNSTAPSLGDLGVGKAKGAIINTMAASLWPYKLVARIVQDQVQERADFSLHTNTPVTSLETATGDADGPWRVCTPRGSCIARHVLLATNGYTSHLLPNMRDVIEPVRGNMIAGRGGGDLLLNHSYGLVDELSGDEHKDLIRVSERLIGDGEYLMQRPAERGAAGLGTIAESPVLALGGARFMMPNSGYGLSNDDRLDPEANKFLRGRLAQVLDAVAAEPETFKVTHEWTGILGYSKDGFPWVGELREGLWLCAGYSGHGMPQAALCATSVASMILDRLAGHDRDLSKDRGVLPSRFMITPERLKAHGL